MELRVFYSLIKEYVDKASKHMENSNELVAKLKCPLCKIEFKSEYDGPLSLEIYIDFELLEKMSIEYVNYMK
jgi:hypothetical protein